MTRILAFIITTDFKNSFCMFLILKKIQERKVYFGPKRSSFISQKEHEGKKTNYPA